MNYPIVPLRALLAGTATCGLAVALDIGIARILGDPQWVRVLAASAINVIVIGASLKLLGPWTRPAPRGHHHRP